MILGANGEPYNLTQNTYQEGGGFEKFMAAYEKDPARVKKIMIELDQQTRSLTKKDVARWRQSHQTALNIENPKRRELYSIYADAEIDMHLTGCVGQLDTAVLGRGFKIMDRKTNTQVDALTNIFEASWFKTFMQYDLDSYNWGHSLIQLGNVVTLRGVKRFDDVELIPREHVCPEYGVILRDPSDDVSQGTPYRNNTMHKWLIECGDKKNLGLYLKCCPHTISKKNMAAYWDTFGEIFGIPIRIAKTTSRDIKDHNAIMSMLQSMGAAAYALFPEGTTVDIKESGQGDSFNVFDKRIARCDKEISKGILLQTMTIDDGSSRSQSETHLDIFNRVVESRADHIRDTVNNELIPRMQMLGFPLTDNHYFDWDYAVEYTPEEQIAIERMVLEKYDVDPSYFKEKYNIPITGSRAAQAAMQLPETVKKKSKLNESLTALYGERPVTAAATPTPPDIDELLKNIHSGKDIYIDPDMINVSAEQMKEALREGYDLDWSDVTINTPDFEMLTHLENNVYQFAAAKNYQELRELTDNLLDEQGNPLSFSSFQEVARGIDSRYNVDWLATERNTAISSAMTARDWTTYQANKVTMPMLRYITAGDKRVRSEHAALDGIQHHIDDDFWNTYYPPNGFNCRCTTTQTGIKQTTSRDTFIPPDVPEIFKTNLAKTGLIFPKNHPYYDGVPNSVMRKAVAYLPPENTFRTVNIGENMTVDIHPMHGAEERNENVEIARMLKLNGYKDIKLMPVIHEKDAPVKRKFYPDGYKFADIRKNADAIVDGEVFDFKFSSKRNLSKRIKEGALQAGNVVIHLREDIEDSDLKNTCSRVRKECSVKNILIVRHNKTLLKL